MTYETTDELFEAKRGQALNRLMLAQKEGEGITPGVFRNSLKMEEHDFLGLMEQLKEEGIIAILPPDPKMKRGRRSPVIHATKILRGPDPNNIREMLSDFVPVATEDDNPFYLIDKSRRGSTDDIAVALGTSALQVIVDEMLTFSGRKFTVKQLKNSLQQSVRVPEHIVDFVWFRFTHDLYEESNYNGGWNIHVEDGVTKLKRRGYLSGDEIELKHYNTVQEAVENAYIKNIGHTSNRYIFADHYTEEEKQKCRDHVNYMAQVGSAPAVIEHPQLKTWHGKRQQRQQYMEGFEEWPDIVGVDSGSFAVIRDIFGCPDEEHRMNLVALAQAEVTPLEALNTYEKYHGHELSEE